MPAGRGRPREAIAAGDGAAAAACPRGVAVPAWPSYVTDTHDAQHMAGVSRHDCAVSPHDAIECLACVIRMELTGT